MSDLPLYGARATDAIDAMLPESSRDPLQLAEQRRVSTDPNWPSMIPVHETGTAPPAQSNDLRVGPGGETAAIGCQPGPVRRPTPPDGRRTRAEKTTANVLAACRELMMGGVFRPSMSEICDLARRSKRSGHQHFTTIEALHFEALQDGVVREAVLERAVGPQIVFLMPETRARILRAIITGKA